MTVYTIEKIGYEGSHYQLGIYATEEVAKKVIQAIYDKVVSQYEGDDNLEAVLNDDKNEINTYYEGEGPCDTWTIVERQVIEE